MNNNCLVTILTPVYNRKDCMMKLYHSLQVQTDKEFNWLIVDDGSDDHLEEFVEAIKFETPFPIKYIRKENGGKHTAINLGVSYIESQLTFIVDSDDWLERNAIEVVKKLWNQYDKDENIGGVQLQTYLLNGKDPMQLFEKEGVFYMKNMKKRGIDCATIYRTDILKKFPFPVYNNERFCSEGCVWIPINDQYKLIFSNKIVRNSEYRDDGLTAGGIKLLLENPRGMMANTLAIYYSDSFSYLERLKHMISYVSYGLFAHLSAGDIIRGSRSGTIASLCYPLGYMLYKIRKNIYYN